MRILPTTASFNDLVNVPAGLADGDGNTQLTENRVVTFVSDNGFVRDVDLADIATTAVSMTLSMCQRASLTATTIRS